MRRSSNPSRWSWFAWFALVGGWLLYPSTAAASNAEGCVGAVSLVSRSTDKLDAFAVDAEGDVRTAAWQAGDSAFEVGGASAASRQRPVHR